MTDGNVERATCDLIVIGSGPAGEKGAAQAAYFDKKVALVEEASSYGGAVANTGVPGKAMRETALYLSGFRQRDLHGLTLAYDGHSDCRPVHEPGPRGAPDPQSVDRLSDLCKYAAYDAMGRVRRGDVYRP